MIKVAQPTKHKKQPPPDSPARQLRAAKRDLKKCATYGNAVAVQRAIAALDGWKRDNIKVVYNEERSGPPRGSEIPS